MKLIIQRNQRERKGLLGGHRGMSFILSCRVELTKDEQALIDKYQVGYYTLTYKEREGQQIPSLTIQDLLRGVNYEIDDVGTLLNNEEVIKEACQDFKNLLVVMESFGGEEVYEF